MEIQKIALSELNPYPNNPRKGNIDLIAESLETYGQYKPITVNKRTNQILAGNHTYQAAQKLGWNDIAVTYVDVNETTAAKIVAIDNKTSDMGGYDAGKLLELLDELPDLAATGYEQDDLDDLMALLDEQKTPEIAPDTTFVMPAIGNTESPEDNVSTVMKMSEYADRYAAKQTRIFMVDYHNSVFIWVIDKLTEYRTKHNLISNADAIIKLLEEETGEKAPDETI
jgi:ParB-like nuclease domain